MKGLVTIAFAAGLLVGGMSSVRGEEPLPARQLLLRVRVCEGEPRDGREAGKLKVLAEPAVVTVENRPFSVFVGGEIAVSESDPELIPFGLRFDGKPGVVKDGKVRLDITVANTAVAERTNDRLQLYTETTRTITTVQVGEVTKFRYGKASPDKQMWVELSVEEVKP